MIPLGTVRKLLPVSDEAPVNTKKLRRLRIAAFNSQCGRCCYCNLPIWEVDPTRFAAKYDLTTRQARQLRSTAEHLRARCDGGRDTPSNIAAACWQCNRLRHRPRQVKPPNVWRAICRKRVSRVYSLGRFNCWAHCSLYARSLPSSRNVYAPSLCCTASKGFSP